MAQGIRRPHEAVDYAAIDADVPAAARVLRDRVLRRPRRRSSARSSRACSDKALARATRCRSSATLGRRRVPPERHRARSTTCGSARPTPSTTSARASTTTRRSATTRASRRPTPLREPMRVFMSGGTTGKSRPTFYTQWDREVGALLTARRALHCRASGPATSCSTRGPTDCTTARSASTRRCTAGSTAWCSPRAPATSPAPRSRSSSRSSTARPRSCTTGDYLLRIADAAREMGYDPETDLKLTRAAEHRRSRGARRGVRRRVLPVVRVPRGAVGVGGVPDARGPAHLRGRASSCRSSIPRPASRCPTASSVRSCITELYKTGSPQFRYNIMDLSCLYPRGQCACGSWLRSMGPFSGRGDNMVKLRGINVWPEGVGEVACAVDGIEPDYFVRASGAGQPRRAGDRGGERSRPRDVRRDPRRDRAAAAAALGVKIAREVVGTRRARRRTPSSTRPRNPSDSATNGQGQGMTDDRCTSTTCQRVHARSRSGVGRRDRGPGGADQGAARSRPTASANPTCSVARMDELGIATCLVPTSDLPHHGTPFEYDPVAAAARRDGCAASRPTPAGSRRGGRSTRSSAWPACAAPPRCCATILIRASRPRCVYLADEWSLYRRSDVFSEAANRLLYNHAK